MVSRVGQGGSTTTAANSLLGLMFQLAGKAFAVDLTQVEQIIEYRPPTRTPRPPPYVEGVLDYRGRFLPVMSLRRRLGIPDEESGHPAILLLTGVGPDGILGVTVDQVLRVLSLSREHVLLPPPRVFGIRAEFIRGVANVGGRPIVWLDMGKLLLSTEPIAWLG
jgi:purine-binding chemotaxis protein CheW